MQSQKAPKQKNRVQFVAQPNIREVNWSRDVPGTVQVPAAVKDHLDAISMEHTSVRKQLDILRSTRSQRTLEPLKIPVELQRGIPMSDAGVRRSTVADAGDVAGE